MKICLVATFPPSGRQLNEYAFYIARELQRNPRIKLTILADELTDYEFATDQNGNSLKADEQGELPGFDVIRCWKFNSLATPVRLLNTIRKIKPDVVWFNLVFSSFATPDYPVAAPDRRAIFWDEEAFPGGQALADAASHLITRLDDRAVSRR